MSAAKSLEQYVQPQRQLLTALQALMSTITATREGWAFMAASQGAVAALAQAVAPGATPPMEKGWEGKPGKTRYACDAGACHLVTGGKTSDTFHFIICHRESAINRAPPAVK